MDTPYGATSEEAFQNTRLICFEKKVITSGFIRIVDWDTNKINVLAFFIIILLITQFNNMSRKAEFM